MDDTKESKKSMRERGVRLIQCIWSSRLFQTVEVLYTASTRGRIRICIFVSPDGALSKIVFLSKILPTEE